MDNAGNPPKKKRAGRNQGPESIRGKHPGERAQPAAAEETRDAPPAPAREREEPNRTSSTPITNQDEQDRITNADQDPPASEH